MRHRAFNRRRLRGAKRPPTFNPGINFAVAAAGMLALQPSLHTHTPNNNVGLVVAFMAGSLGSAIVSPVLNGFFAGYSITDKGHSIPTSSVFASSRKASKVIVLKDVKPHKLGLVSSLSVTVLSSANNGDDVRLGESRQGGSSSGSSSSGSGGGGHWTGSNNGHGSTQGGNGDGSTPPDNGLRISSNVFGVRKIYDTRQPGSETRKGSGGGGGGGPPPGGTHTSTPGLGDGSQGNDGYFYLLVVAIVVLLYTVANYSHTSKPKRKETKKKRIAAVHAQAVNIPAHNFYRREVASMSIPLAYIDDMQYRFVHESVWEDMDWASGETKVIMDICNGVGVYCNKPSDFSFKENVFVDDMTRNTVVSRIGSLYTGRRLRRMFFPVLCLASMVIFKIVVWLYWVIRNVEHIDVEFEGQSIEDPVHHLERGLYADRVQIRECSSNPKRGDFDCSAAFYAVKQDIEDGMSLYLAYRKASLLSRNVDVSDLGVSDTCSLTESFVDKDDYGVVLTTNLERVVPNMDVFGEIIALEYDGGNNVVSVQNGVKDVD